MKLEFWALQTQTKMRGNEEKIIMIICLLWTRNICVVFIKWSYKWQRMHLIPNELSNDLFKAIYFKQSLFSVTWIIILLKLFRMNERAYARCLFIVISFNSTSSYIFFRCLVQKCKLHWFYQNFRIERVFGLPANNRSKSWHFSYCLSEAIYWLIS